MQKIGMTALSYRFFYHLHKIFVKKQGNLVHVTPMCYNDTIIRCVDGKTENRMGMAKQKETAKGAIS